MIWLFEHLYLVPPIFLLLIVASVGFNIACHQRWYTSISLILGMMTFPLYLLVSTWMGMSVAAIAIPWIMLWAAVIFDIGSWIKMLIPDQWIDSEDGRDIRTPHENAV